MNEHVSCLGVLWLIYCVSFAHGFGRDNAIALAPKPCPFHTGLAPNGSCVPCLSRLHGCEDCSSNYRKCQWCGPYQGLDRYSACTYCLLNNCHECSADYRVCKACTPGYVLENNVCKRCDTTPGRGLTWCDKSCEKSNCSSCFEGRFNMANARYDFSDYHASLTNESTCAVCSTFDYYNGSTCVNCPYPCRTCKGNGFGKAKCTTCEDDSEFYDLMPNGTCAYRCQWNCKCHRYRGEVQCVGFEDGSVQWGNTCFSCSYSTKNCQACSSVDPWKCTACKAGFVLLEDPKKGNTCHQCPQNCEKCHLDSGNNAYICTQCNTKTTLISNGTCANCPQDCEKCHLDSGNNIICTTGGCIYSSILLPNGTCQRPPSGCREWALEGNGLVCKMCYKGYGVAANGSCVDCGRDCSTCSVDESGRPMCLEVGFR